MLATSSFITEKCICSQKEKERGRGGLTICCFMLGREAIHCYRVTDFIFDFGQTLLIQFDVKLNYWHVVNKSFSARNTWVGIISIIAVTQLKITLNTQIHRWAIQTLNFKMLRWMDNGYISVCIAKHQRNLRFLIFLLLSKIDSKIDSSDCDIYQTNSRTNKIVKKREKFECMWFAGRLWSKS